jgi:hypothetical protein
MVLKPPEADGREQKPPAQPQAGPRVPHPREIEGQGRQLKEDEIRLRLTVPPIPPDNLLHVRPSTIITNVLEEFRHMNRRNNLFIPWYKDESDPAVTPEGDVRDWNKWSAHTTLNLSQFQTPSGRTVDFIVKGPNRIQLASVLTYMFHNPQGLANIQRTALDFIHDFRDGRIPMLSLTEPTEDFESPNRQLGSQPSVTIGVMGEAFAQLLKREQVIEGGGPQTGLAFYGLARDREIEDYTWSLGLCTEQQVRDESSRLMLLRTLVERQVREFPDEPTKPLPARIIRSVFGRREGEPERLSREAREVLKATLKLESDILTAAVSIINTPLTSSTVEANGRVFQVSPDIRCPNAQLAVSLAVGERMKVARKGFRDDLRRSENKLLHTLCRGIDIDSAAEEVLLLAVGQQPDSDNRFTRAGLFMLDGSSLVSRFEWKDGVFIARDVGSSIPLRKEGDGTAHTARMGQGRTTPFIYISNAIRTDPNTSQGYVEYDQCAWVSINNQEGRTIGVLWADMGGRPNSSGATEITPGMGNWLSHCAQRAGTFFSMVKGIREVAPEHKREVVAFMRDQPNDNLVVRLSERWGGMLISGSPTDHPLTIAGSLRFPTVAIPPERTEQLRSLDGKRVLLLDPGAGAACVVVNPSWNVLSVLGISEADLGTTVNLHGKVTEEQIRPNLTRDGRLVSLRGSLQGNPVNLRRYTELLPEGTGLYRTEHAFMFRPPPFTIDPKNPRTIELLREYFHEQYAQLLTGLINHHIVFMRTHPRAVEMYQDRYSKEQFALLPLNPFRLRTLDVTTKKCAELHPTYGIPRVSGLAYTIEHPELLQAQLDGFCSATQSIVQYIQQEGGKTIPVIDDIPAAINMGVMVPNARELAHIHTFTEMLAQANRTYCPSIRMQRVAQIEDFQLLKDEAFMLQAMAMVDAVAIGSNDASADNHNLKYNVRLDRGHVPPYAEFDPTFLIGLSTASDIIQKGGKRCLLCGRMSETLPGILTAMTISPVFNQMSMPSRCAAYVRPVLPFIDIREFHDRLNPVLDEKWAAQHSGRDVFTMVLQEMLRQTKPEFDRISAIRTARPDDPEVRSHITFLGVVDATRSQQSMEVYRTAQSDSAK